MNLWLSNNSCNRVFGSNIMLNLLSLPPTFKKILCCFLFCIQNYFNAIWIFLLHKISLTSRPFLKNSFNPLLILILFSTCWIFHISKTCYFPEQSAKVVKKVFILFCSWKLQQNVTIVWAIKACLCLCKVSSCVWLPTSFCLKGLCKIKIKPGKDILNKANFYL